MLIPAISVPDGRGAEALDFYKEVFGATVHSVVHGSDAPPDSEYAAGDSAGRIIHSELTIRGVRINLSESDDDIIPGNMVTFNIFSDTVDDVTEIFNKLAKSSVVLTPLGPQFWTPIYGEIIDRFGLRWQVMQN